MTVESLVISNEFDKYLDGEVDMDSVAKMRKTTNNFFKVETNDGSNDRCIVK